MSEFKKQLEIAQAFQLELAEVTYLNVNVATGFSVEIMESYVSVGVCTYSNSKLGQCFILIGDQVTEQALADIKDNLRGLGYEI